MPETKDLEWTFNTAAYAYDKFRPHFQSFSIPLHLVVFSELVVTKVNHNFSAT